ncbi:hypothetical protein BT69DRAFT_1286139 [Atractiella rhizophila]|nr:hypothetical protein BT69DRAFT_1286139 [Atractiella rhizophila]
MAFFGFRAWPVPFVGPMWVFAAGGALTWWQIKKAQDALLQAPEYRDSPKNPYRNAAAAEHH